MFFGNINFNNFKEIVSNITSTDIASINIEQIKAFNKETTAYTITCKNNTDYQEMFFVDYFGSIFCILITKDNFRSFKLALNKNEFKDYDFVSNLDSVIDNFTYRTSEYTNYYNAPYENIISLLFEMAYNDLEFTHDLTFTSAKHANCTMQIIISDNENIRAYGECIS